MYRSNNEVLPLEISIMQKTCNRGYVCQNKIITMITNTYNKLY